jgi:hypothetical protein
VLPHRTLPREWTALSADAERRELDMQLADARARRDASEVKRIQARLRLLANG